MIKTVETREVRIRTRDGELDATLALPRTPVGVVLFSHGSGSSRLSPRDRHVAGVLNQAGFATVLPDLLTPGEERVDERMDERTRRLRLDVGFLARRLVDVVDWAAGAPDTRELPIGCCGTGTGAAAALVAAAERPERVGAVVSSVGRPDLAGDALSRIRAPTLLIVGGADASVMRMNHEALGRMGDVEAVMHVLDGATHRFDEPGALEEVAALARAWFLAKLADRIDPAAARIPVAAVPLAVSADGCGPADAYRLDPECGIPGGGAGRKDLVGGSGVYPVSAGTAPPGAVVRTQAAWGQGDRGAEGFYDAGGRGLYFHPAEPAAAGTAESRAEEPE